MSVGQVVSITTTDGHTLRGRIIVTSPEKIVLAAAFGMAFVLRESIVSWASA